MTIVVLSLGLAVSFISVKIAIAYNQNISIDIMSTIIVDIVYSVVYILFLFLFYKHLLYKREHDRNNDGKTRVISILIIFSIICILSSVIDILPIISMSIYVQIVNYIMVGFGWISLILIRPLLFRKGIT